MRYSARKLTTKDVELIRQLIEEREELKRKARELSASRIAEKFEVHPRTIERLTSGQYWNA